MGGKRGGFGDIRNSWISLEGAVADFDVVIADTSVFLGYHGLCRKSGEQEELSCMSKIFGQIKKMDNVYITHRVRNELVCDEVMTHLRRCGLIANLRKRCDIVDYMDESRRVLSNPVSSSCFGVLGKTEDHSSYRELSPADAGILKMGLLLAESGKKTVILTNDGPMHVAWENAVRDRRVKELGVTSEYYATAWRRGLAKYEVNSAAV